MGPFNFSAVRNQSRTVAPIVRRDNVKVVRASRKPVVAGTRVPRNMVSPPMSVRSERGARPLLRVDTDNSSHSVPLSNRRNPIAIHIRLGPFETPTYVYLCHPVPPHVSFPLGMVMDKYPIGKKHVLSLLPILKTIL